MAGGDGGRGDRRDARRRHLADLGLDTADLGDLWDAVREELAERTVGPEIDLGEFDPQMTVSDAARIMAWLLAGAGDGEDDEQR